MKIACLQFDPQIGKVQDNIHKADEILGNALGIGNIQDQVDVLVLVSSTDLQPRNAA